MAFPPLRSHRFRPRTADHLGPGMTLDEPAHESADSLIRLFHSRRDGIAL